MSDICVFRGTEAERIFPGGTQVTKNGQGQSELLFGLGAVAARFIYEENYVLFLVCFLTPYFLLYWQTSMEISKMQKELNEKLSEIRRLQMELNRREDEGTDDIVGNLRRVVATLERENNSLKVSSFMLLKFAVM